MFSKRDQAQQVYHIPDCVPGTGGDRFNRLREAAAAAAEAASGLNLCMKNDHVMQKAHPNLLHPNSLPLLSSRLHAARLHHLFSRRRRLS